MTEKKIKTYNIMLSRVFPDTHPRAGEDTGFKPKVLTALNNLPCYRQKLHTIRANYPLWKKRFEEVERGEAVIKLRQWTDRPYRSKTVLIKTLTAKNGIGLQKLTMRMPDRGNLPFYVIDDCMFFSTANVLSKNDGLSLDDWQSWFKDYDWTQPLAIIHFTPFRYKACLDL